jgi:His/Glu/Gln/Arg/opine family amino acid ABC transporter permease subunit
MVSMRRLRDWFGSSELSVNGGAVRVGSMRANRRRATATGFVVSSVLPTVLLAVLFAWLLSEVDWSFVSTLDFSVVYKYRVALLQGLLGTILITTVSLLLGLALGLAFACLLQVPFEPLRWAILAYIELLRDIPLVLALFWIHFALPLATGFSTTAFQSGFIAMAFQSSAYLADVARAGIQAVPRGQWDAADALGLSRTWKWLEIVLPQALKIIIPPLANVAIGYFKASSILALLSVGELMTVAARVSSYSFKPIETLTTVGLVYLALGYVLSSLTYRLERAVKTSGV